MDVSDGGSRRKRARRILDLFFVFELFPGEWRMLKPLFFAGFADQSAHCPDFLLPPVSGQPKQGAVPIAWQLNGLPVALGRFVSCRLMVLFACHGEHCKWFLPNLKEMLLAN